MDESAVADISRVRSAEVKATYAPAVATAGVRRQSVSGGRDQIAVDVQRQAVDGVPRDLDVVPTVGVEGLDGHLGFAVGADVDVAVAVHHDDAVDAGGHEHHVVGEALEPHPRADSDAL